MGNERGSYFDRWERGEYSIDPRDLIPTPRRIVFGTVGVRDREAFELYFGPIEEAGVVKPIIEPAKTAEPAVVKEFVLIAA